ncbi:MAG: metal-sulfur cluster assembly factor [Pirellula sp.]|nr:metal-sulfur cluster assembly factor [Pirellula sp.]
MSESKQPSELQATEPKAAETKAAELSTVALESACCQTPTCETLPKSSDAPVGLCEDKVREELKRVIDPELFVNIVDLGLIYVVDIQPGEEGKQNVNVEMTMTSPMCPAGPQLVANSRQVVEEIPGVGVVDIKVVMDPPWTPDKMTEDARDQLGIF